MIKVFSVFTLFAGIAVMGSVFTGEPVLLLGSALIGFSAGLMVSA